MLDHIAKRSRLQRLHLNKLIRPHRWNYPRAQTHYNYLKHVVLDPFSCPIIHQLPISIKSTQMDQCSQAWILKDLVRLVESTKEKLEPRNRIWRNNSYVLEATTWQRVFREIGAIFKDLQLIRTLVYVLLPKTLNASPRSRGQCLRVVAPMLVVTVFKCLTFLALLITVLFE